MKLSAELSTKLKNLPEQPGVYRFLNKKGTILYIGKAKSLKKRVNSYFVGISKHSYRIQHLVENIFEVEYTVVNTEIEALVLENNLIKNHQPKYNILLKDGKSYPYICITNERFPRLFSTRQKEDSNATYFGPYVNTGVMHTLLELIKGYIKLRTCTYLLSEENIRAKKFRACLEYQIGNCAAPCIGQQSEFDYLQDIEKVKYILKGNFKPVLEHLEILMYAAAEEYAFEQAEMYRKKIEQIIAYRNKNTIVSEKLNDLEVLSVAMEDSLAIVNHFKLHNGTIIQTHSLEVKRQNNEEEAEILVAALEYFIGEGIEFFSEIVVSHAIEEESFAALFQFTVPQKGDKKHLLDLSLKNCRTLLAEKIHLQNMRNKKTPNIIMMEELQKVLHLKELPDHIECFDNSNFQGSFPVSAMVCFKNGKPAKKDYRHFNVKTVEGPNDFATMEEAVTRRYKRVLAENLPLPKLIIIDGGKGQLSAASKALESVGLLGKVPMIGIAKRLEEIYSINDEIPLHIDKKSPALILIQQLRDEAHRFGITFHRDQRSRGVNQRTHLSEIDGIGDNTAQKLLTHFRSVKKLKEATEEQIAEVIGKHRANIIVQAIQNNEI